MPKVKASELVQELIDKWNTVLELILKTTRCPFTKELEERANKECYIHPPSHDRYVCDHCLATYELCQKYMKIESQVRFKVYDVIELLGEHSKIYERHEK